MTNAPFISHNAPDIGSVAPKPADSSWQTGVRRAVVWCIRAYQSTAPMRPAVCRYHPTCSEYAAQCILKHGVFAGVALGLRRILRCNPLSTGGYDPVPDQI